MAGPVFNVSTNKHGSNLCLRVWKPRLVELNGSLENNKKKEGYGCLDKNTLKCHYAHLECPALTGTSWLQLLAAPPPHPALPAQGAGPAAHQQEGGSRVGTGKWHPGAAQCPLCPLCQGSLELCWGQMEGGKRNTQAWLMGSKLTRALQESFASHPQKDIPRPKSWRI